MAGTRYVGFAEETTLGSWVDPTKYSELVTETVIPNKRYIFPETSRAVSPTKKMTGNYLQSGDISFLCAPENLTPYICKWNLGTPATTTPESEVYQHVFKPSSSLKSASLELGIESMTRKLAGSIVDVLSIEGIVGRPLVLTASIFAKEESKGSIGTPSYSPVADFNYTDAKIKIGGTLRSYVRAFRLRIGNSIPIDELFTLGYSGFQSVEVGYPHLVDGTLDLLFPDSTEYDRFLAETEFAIQLKAEGVLCGATQKYTFQVDVPQAIYTSDAAPHIDRQMPLRLRAPFRGEWKTSDSADVIVTMINTLATI